MPSKYFHKIKRLWGIIKEPFKMKRTEQELLIKYYNNLLNNIDMSTLQPLNIEIDEIYTRNECDYYTNNSSGMFNIDHFHIKLYVDNVRLIPYYGDAYTFIDFLKNVKTIKYFKYNTVIMIHNNEKINSIFLNYKNSLLSQNLYVQLSKCELFIYQYYQSRRNQIKNKIINKEDNINETNGYLF